MWGTCGRGPQLLNQAITQPSRLERTSRALWTHLPLRGIYSDQVVQGYVQFNLEHLQGHWSHTLSGQLLPVFDQPHGWSNKILYIENFQIFVCFRQWLLPLFLFLQTPRKILALFSLLFVICRQQLDLLETFFWGWTDQTIPASPQMFQPANRLVATHRTSYAYWKAQNCAQYFTSAR